PDHAGCVGRQRAAVDAGALCQYLQGRRRRLRISPVRELSTRMGRRARSPDRQGARGGQGVHRAAIEGVSAELRAKPASEATEPSFIVLELACWAAIEVLQLWDADRSQLYNYRRASMGHGHRLSTSVFEALGTFWPAGGVLLHCRC